MAPRLPTHLLITSAIRTAAQEGVVITIVRKGDAERGAMVLKINTLDGRCRLYEQAWREDEPVWTPLTDAVAESEADARLARTVGYDPDAWVIEIEDRLGRLWLPGRVLT